MCVALIIKEPYVDVNKYSQSTSPKGTTFQMVGHISSCTVLEIRKG
jgi:hypothetical protein